PNTLADSDNAVLTVELNGGLAGTVDGLVITAGNSTVRGLVVSGFHRQFGGGGGRGIRLFSGGNNVIAGNFIGTDPTGTQSRGNTEIGVEIQSSDNRIGGTDPADRNLVSGNNDLVTGNETPGIYMSGTNNVTLGNYIGTDVTGTLALPNGDGVMLDSVT